MLRFPLQVLELSTASLTPAISNDSSSVASISVSVPAPVSAAMSASGGDSVPAAKKTKRCVPSAGADVVAPLGTSTMPPLWLEQGHALWIIDELKKCRRGGDAPKWLNSDVSLFRTAV